MESQLSIGAGIARPLEFVEWVAGHSVEEGGGRLGEGQRRIDRGGHVRFEIGQSLGQVVRPMTDDGVADQLKAEIAVELDGACALGVGMKVDRIVIRRHPPHQRRKHPTTDSPPFVRSFNFDPVERGDIAIGGPDEARADGQPVRIADELAALEEERASIRVDALEVVGHLVEVAGGGGLLIKGEAFPERQFIRPNRSHRVAVGQGTKGIRIEPPTEHEQIHDVR